MYHLRGAYHLCLPSFKSVTEIISTWPVGECFFDSSFDSSFVTLQENLAFMKPTAQSSTIASYASKNAVDGNRGTWIGTCTHTDGSGSTNPWWRVDLGRVEPVSELFIVNRGEGSGYRLNGFEIRVGECVTC